MRGFARIRCTLAMLALAAPAVAWAQAPASMGRGASQPSKKFWFHRGTRCAECQREEARMKDGAYVPPPPPLPGAAPSSHNCATCGGTRMVLTTTGPMTVVPGASAPMGPMYAPGDAPGYASTDGGPSPVGEFHPQLAGIPMPGQAPGPVGLRDSSVGLSNYSPTPLIPAGANRPRILSHLTGVSGIGRDWREAWGRRREEAHASIPMGDVSGPVVNDLPARMVYGRGR